MSIWNDLLMGFGVALQPNNLLYGLFGVLIGQIIGALPGIGPPSGVALLLPLTFNMDPTSAIIMLAGIYYGAMYGGTITSVLINTPGESASVVTTLDGYQMALKGRAGPALGIAAIGSFIAGTFGVLMLMLLAPTLVKFALRFGPPEYFALLCLGLTTVTSLSGGSMVKGIIATLIGLILATVGLDIVSGSARFTFGITELLDGFDFLPVAIGLFGLGEVLSGAEEAADAKILQARLGLRDVFPSLKDWAESKWALLRGTVIGFLVGNLPGAGATVASFMAYAVEKKLSKHPEKFGTGIIEGVASPEAANNAASAGAMVPLLTLGIPSSSTTAVMLGAFLMWGLRPGPTLLQDNPKFVWGLIASMYVGNVMLVILNVALVPMFVAVLRIPYSILMPLIVVFSMVGAYSLNNNLFDVWTMVFFGLIGWLFKKLDYPAAALVLALVLGQLTENALRQSLMMSQGEFSIFFTRPIAATLLIAAIVALFAPLVRWMWWRLRRPYFQAAAGE